MATLFECAIIVNEKRDAANNITEPAVIVKEPFYIIATNQQQATLMAGKDVPDDILTDPERFERAVVIVRPFDAGGIAMPEMAGDAVNLLRAVPQSPKMSTYNAVSTLR